MAFGDDPVQAFPGNGRQSPEQTEITRLKREVAKLKAERDILKKPRSTSRRRANKVRLHREAPGDLAGRLEVRGGARCLARGLLCLAYAATQQRPTKSMGAAVVAGVDAAPVFEFAEHVLDLVALAVERAIMRDRHSAVGL